MNIESAFSMLLNFLFGCVLGYLLGIVLFVSLVIGGITYIIKHQTPMAPGSNNPMRDFYPNSSSSHTHH